MPVAAKKIVHTQSGTRGVHSDRELHVISARDGLRDRGKIVILSVFLAIFTIGLYSPVRNHPFINYDDQQYVVDNAHVKAGLSWDTLVWSLRSTDAANWHPITWLSHTLDFELYGLDASGHHWTSLLLHALNAVLLFLLLQRVTGATWKSMFVAGLFAVHPLNVESVAWIAERKNVLSTFFFFAALGAYGWYTRRPGIRRYLVLAILFVFGLASKPMVITLPCVLLLLDFWPLRRVKNWSEPSREFPVEQITFRRAFVEKLPLFVIAAISALITLIAQKQNVVSTVLLPIGVRLRTIPYAYGMYLWKTFWPARLAPIYPHPGLTLPLWIPLLDSMVLILVSVLVWLPRKKQPYLLTGWLWFLGTAVPVIGIVQVGDQVIADRYAYLPVLGVFVTLVWGMSAFADRVRLNNGIRAVAAATLVLVLCAMTWRQLSYWDSTIDLWQHTLAVTKDNSMAENFLANELLVSGRFDEGMVHLRNYAKMEPLDPLAHVRVAADDQDRGDLVDAAKEFETGIRAANVLNRRGLPSLSSEAMAISYSNLALVYAELGDDAKAKPSMNSALSVNPQAVDHMMGELVRALAVNRKPYGYLRLGYLLKLIGHDAEARQAFSWASRLDPTIRIPAGY